MSKCPFHAHSSSTTVRGEIHNIECASCGEYRISETALKMLEGRALQSAPNGWTDIISQRPVISTRDTARLAV